MRVGGQIARQLSMAVAVQVTNKDFERLMRKLSLKFKELNDVETNPGYSDGCSGNRSDCCTRVCTRNDVNSVDEQARAWDDYLEVNAGVLQY